MLPPSRRARTSSQNSSLSPHCAGGLEKQGRKPRLVEPVDRPPFARGFMRPVTRHRKRACQARSEEHTSELQSLMRISYAVFCLKKKTTNHIKTKIHHRHNIQI